MARAPNSLATVDENARRRFEQAWHQGQPEPIERFLPSSDHPLYLPTLEELVSIELEFTWKTRRRVQVENYLKRFPHLKDPAIIERLVRQELRVREAVGDRPSTDELKARFPSLVDKGLDAADVSTGNARLETPQGETVSHVAGVGRQSVSALPTPTVPGYEILAELGRGGMGVVFKARQSSLNRIVALKMILAGRLAGEGDLARFQTEAEAVARLQHPGIVQIHETGIQDGMPYFSLEYVGGGSLASRLNGQPLSAAIAARLTALLARAMQTAHEQGILHRDLKPANIFLMPTKDRDGVPIDVAGSRRLTDTAASAVRFFPKIGDFGLAKKLDTTPTSATDEAERNGAQTETGALLGTPSYMAPEQAEGRTTELGPATDVYALGVILYELLTGRPPFRAATTLETLAQVARDDAVPPSRLNAAIPRDVETICLKCLMKEPSKRYASAQGLAEDLERFLRHEPIQARRAGWVERSAKWVRRHPARAGLVIAGLLLLLAVMGGGVSLAYSGRVAAERDLARKKEAEAQAEKDRAELAERLARKEKEDADEAKRLAMLAEADAKQQHDRAELLVYAKNLDLAQRAWEEGDVIRASNMVNGSRADFRRFEHDYLFTLLNTNQRSFCGHVTPIMGVAFSPDGTRIASTDQFKTLKIWEVATGNELRVFKGNTCSRPVFSGDGTKIIGADGKALRAWDVATGREILSREAHGDSIVAVGLSADGKKVVSLSKDSVVKVHDATTWTEDSSFKVSALGPVEVPKIEAGRILLLGSGEPSVWDAATGQQKLALNNIGVPHEAALSSDGKRFVLGWYDGSKRIWDIETGQLRATLTGPISLGMALNNDGTRLVTGGIGKPKLADPFGDAGVRVWNVETGQQVRLLKGHTEAVRNVAVSSDGKKIVSGGDEGIVKVWDLQGSQDTPTIKAHAQDVNSVAFSADGKRFISGSREGIVKVWDPANWRETATLQGHAKSVACVAVSADGSMVVSGSEDGTVKVWRTDKPEPLRTLDAHRGGQNRGVFSVAISADGTRIISGGDDGTAKVWNAETGDLTLTFNGHKKTGRVGNVSVQAVAITPDGKTVASGAQGDVTLVLWDAQTGAERVSINDNPPWCLALSPDGQRVAAGFGSWGPIGAKVWDAQTGRELLELAGHRSPVVTIAFSPDGHRLLTGGSDSALKLWDVRTGIETLSLTTADVRCVTFSPDGKRIVNGAKDGSLKVWSAESTQETLVSGTPEAHSRHGLLGIAFRSDGRRFVSAEAKTLKIWDADLWQELLSIRLPGGYITGVAFSPDGAKIVASNSDKTLMKIWNAETGQEIRTLGMDQKPGHGVAWSPDGKSIVAGIEDGIMIWDAETGATVLTAKNQLGAVSCVGFSPNGTKIVSGGIAGAVVIQDMKTGNVSATFTGHGTGVRSVAFSPDGSRVVSGGTDGTVRLWTVGGGPEVCILKGHTDTVLSVSFRADGNIVVSGGEDATVREWDVDKGLEIRTLRGHISRVQGVAYRPGATDIASAASDGTARLWRSGSSR